ncbi:sigma 54-interacting transcriptional regulator [Variovorax sp. J22R24]|uniref:sigma 54-interacting transcriptional regulator n=1 Tax=Variovorax gracilis TaxID=3053502 RepID=UPI00257902C4|nr:sigma 54-interacting transcriptional regulator [Variovorax sp. J22R24]MDM0109276.1 sigma 54-interacting transcriptional regulator [Variovorax sp. J22R24]
MRTNSSSCSQTEAIPSAMEERDFDSTMLAQNLVGRSACFREAMALVQLYAAWSAPLLISGETGTGKELVARAVHYQAQRRHRPFIPVNCATLPDTLVESELFGHTRGAFTDASQAREGLVRMAEGGTLFLDEMEALSPRGQGALLRFLQDSSYRALGGNQLHHADVRIVAATNTNLHERAAARGFRDDLLYRLDAFHVNLPPLRERLDDLDLLVPHLLAKAARQTDGVVRRIGPAGLALLRGYDWPGNVRQLENVLLKAHVVCQGCEVGVAELQRCVPELVQADTTQAPVTPSQSLREARRAAVVQAERRFVEDWLARTAGNISAAARLTGIERASLSRLAKKYGVKARELGSI